MSLFGAIVAGRLVQTDFVPVEQNKFLLTIPEPDKVNHITVFMTGVEPFPVGLGASVYFYFPNSEAVGVWQYLGYLSNEKPSAIFKIAKAIDATAAGHAFSAMSTSTIAQIGISVEPLNDIMFQESGVVSQKTQSLDTFNEFSAKMLESFYNYATSFAVQVPGGELCFPVKTLEQWLSNFQRKLATNPYFWRRSN